ncbi:MAG: PTS fructose transporter subunit IIC [Sporolactobacillus sp.]|nr:PTS fructose transporter subunit IIC [Sporolactobacillus sp.]
MSSFWGKLQIKKHAMTAISYLIPIVVAAGFLLAVGNIFGGKSLTTISHTVSVWDAFSTMGSFGLGLLPMVVATGIAFSIADKPGIAPGIVIGMAAKGIGAGFLGGLIGGYIAGWITLAIIKFVKVPKWANGLMPTLVIPFLASALAGLVMFYVIGAPISSGTVWLTGYLNSLDTSSKFIYGIIIGVLASIDYGGAINKTVFAFVLAMQAEGINEPITALILASMVTPLGYTAAYFIAKVFRKKIFFQVEVETLKTAFPMGLVEITEGSLPIVLNDLIRCVIATGCGGAIGGGLSMLWGADSHIPASGLFAVPTMTRPWGFLAALIIGSLVTAIVLVMIKKPVTDDGDSDESAESDINLNDLKIS